MSGKWLEVRDRMTFIPVFAFPVSRSQHRLAGRAGFGEGPYVCVYCPSKDLCQYDPWGWPGEARTLRVAHNYIREHFESLQPGAIIDVEYIEGETTEPKTVPDGWEYL